MPYTYDHPMAPVTSTGVVFLIDPLKNHTWVALGRRSDTADAFPGRWCLPGGFVDVGKETAYEAMIREMDEEMNLDPISMQMFWLDDRPGSDPRYDQVFNTCWATRLSGTPADYPLVAGDDIVEAQWVPAWDPKTRGLAFNHDLILTTALIWLDS